MTDIGTIQTVELPSDSAGDVLDAIDYCYESGWAADGLPVLPPEQSRVEAMLSLEGRPRETVIGYSPCNQPR